MTNENERRSFGGVTGEIIEPSGEARFQWQ
jgi:hypothetical protein